MWAQYLGQEESLEMGREVHSRLLAWEIPWAEDPGRLQLIGSQRVGHDWTDLAQHSTSTFECYKIMHVLCSLFCGIAKDMSAFLWFAQWSSEEKEKEFGFYLIQIEKLYLWPNEARIGSLLPVNASRTHPLYAVTNAQSREKWKVFSAKYIFGCAVALKQVSDLL